MKLKFKFKKKIIIVAAVIITALLISGLITKCAIDKTNNQLADQSPIVPNDYTNSTTFQADINNTYSLIAPSDRVVRVKVNNYKNRRYYQPIFDIEKITGYTFDDTVGDYLEYDVFITEPISGAGGFDICLPDETNLYNNRSMGMFDQNEITARPSGDLSYYCCGRWLHRKVELSAEGLYNGDYWFYVAVDGISEDDEFCVYYDNIKITHAGRNDLYIFNENKEFSSNAPVSFPTKKTGSIDVSIVDISEVGLEMTKTNEEIKNSISKIINSLENDYDILKYPQSNALLQRFVQCKNVLEANVLTDIGAKYTLRELNEISSKIQCNYNNYISPTFVLTSGRTYFSDEELMISFSASSATVQFEGSELFATITSLKYEDCVKFNVYVDGNTEPSNTEILYEDITADYCLCSELEYGVHTVKLVKLTELCWGGMLKINRFNCPDGKIMTAPAAPKRSIEFIGDSVTTGFGNLVTDGGGENYLAEEQDATKTFAYLTAQNFNAEVSVFALSGMSLQSEYQGLNDVDDASVIDTYIYTDYINNRNKYDTFRKTGGYDVVCMHIGDNDFDEYADELDVDNFKSILKKQIANIRLLNTNAKIVLFYSVCDSDNYFERINLFKEVVAELNMNGDKNIYFKKVTPMQPEEGSGASGHPSYLTHERITNELSEVISRITKWEYNSPTADSSSEVSSDESDPFENSDVSETPTQSEVQSDLPPENKEDDLPTLPSFVSAVSM